VFEQLIDELSQLPVTDIYIVAHSMGNRIVGHALQARADKGKETKNLRELLLAAADINANVFRTSSHRSWRHAGNAHDGLRVFL
jgi:esterase/lipase superfamily enzyme